MSKKYVVALIVGAILLGALFAVIFINRKPEAVRFDVNYVWHVEYDPGTGTGLLVRGNRIDHIKNNVQALVLALNMATTQDDPARSQGEGAKSRLPRIILQRVEQKTARVDIANDRYLTESMGSAGAQDFLAGVTYTLTENPGIKAVDFAFRAGEHAMPGVYTRGDFAANYKVEAGKK